MLIAFINFIFDLLAGDNKKLALENLALRQQLATYKHHSKRPVLRKRDRIFWVALLNLWDDWQDTLHIVQPLTVIRWDRRRWQLFWRNKSKPGPGRPKIDRHIRDLIRKMSRDNHTWGAPRIAKELHMLGHDIAESTVAKYMVKRKHPPSQTWRTFIKNHLKHTAAVDFFTVPTATFRILYCLVLLSHDRRKIIHFSVTANPTAQWTAQQIVEAFPWDTAPRFLLHDRDSIFVNDLFNTRVKNMGIEEVISAPRSPWQNPYCERLIGSIRRDCLDHMIILSEKHLKKIMAEYIQYYNQNRGHESLDGDSPETREVQPPGTGKIVSIPVLGGLHHIYKRAG